MDVGETKAQIPLKNKGEHGLKRIEQWGLKNKGEHGLKRIEQWGTKY